MKKMMMVVGFAAMVAAMAVCLCDKENSAVGHSVIPVERSEPKEEVTSVNVPPDKEMNRRSLDNIDELMTGMNEASGDRPTLSLAPCTNGMEAIFMGFSFDSDVEWNRATNYIMDSCDDAAFLSCEYELQPEFHGFNSVEARGDIETRKPYALVFDKHVPGDFSIDEASSWMANLIRDLNGNSNISLEVYDKSEDWIMAKAETSNIRLWACAGAYSLLRFDGVGNDAKKERGIEYQLTVRLNSGEEEETPTQ